MKCSVLSDELTILLFFHTENCYDLRGDLDKLLKLEDRNSRWESVQNCNSELHKVRIAPEIGRSRRNTHVPYSKHHSSKTIKQLSGVSSWIFLAIYQGLAFFILLLAVICYGNEIGK